jgi:hypothetical protein
MSTYQTPSESAPLVDGVGKLTSTANSVERVSPTPTDEEFAAIVAAIELAWPRPVVAIAPPIAPRQGGAWKWSGRWWMTRS